MISVHFKGYFERIRVMYMGNTKWYKDVCSRIDRILPRLNPGFIRKYKVNSIKGMVIRLEEFSSEKCENCENKKQDIDQLLTIIEDISKGKSVDLKEYKELFKKVLTHLKKEHGLVEEREYINQWLVLGMLFGVVFTFWNIYAVSFGLILGIGIGAMLDADAKKKGKQL